MVQFLPEEHGMGTAPVKKARPAPAKDWYSICVWRVTGPTLYTVYIFICIHIYIYISYSLFFLFLSQRKIDILNTSSLVTCAGNAPPEERHAKASPKKQKHRTGFEWLRIDYLHWLHVPKHEGLYIEWKKHTWYINRPCWLFVRYTGLKIYKGKVKKKKMLLVKPLNIQRLLKCSTFRLWYLISDMCSKSFLTHVSITYCILDSQSVLIWPCLTAMRYVHMLCDDRDLGCPSTQRQVVPQCEWRPVQSKSSECDAAWIYCCYSLQYCGLALADYIIIHLVWRPGVANWMTDPLNKWWSDWQYLNDNGRTDRYALVIRSGLTRLWGIETGGLKLWVALFCCTAVLGGLDISTLSTNKFCSIFGIQIKLLATWPCFATFVTVNSVQRCGVIRNGSRDHGNLKTSGLADAKSDACLKGCMDGVLACFISFQPQCGAETHVG